jgi:hypothetical protein
MNFNYFRVKFNFIFKNFKIEKSKMKSTFIECDSIISKHDDESITKHQNTSKSKNNVSYIFEI